MILTDIYVPALQETFDFELDENVPVGLLLMEIAQILARKTGTALGGEEPFLLGSFEKQDILDNALTLAECGIRNGSRLLFV